MANFNYDDVSKLTMDFEELANMPDSVITDMLNAESSVVLAAQKSSAQKYRVKDTGQLINSITAKKPKKYKDGWRSYVTFTGSRTRGKTTTRNAEIAFINEFGRHGMPARPFINAANESSADKAVSAAEEIYDKYLKKLNL